MYGEPINPQKRLERYRPTQWTCGLFSLQGGYCRHETYQGSQFHADLINEGLDSRDLRAFVAELPDRELGPRDFHCCGHLETVGTQSIR